MGLYSVFFSPSTLPPPSLFSQRLATEAERFQMEHVWRDDSEVSERHEPDLISSLTVAILHTDQVVSRTPQEEQEGGTFYS